jgi:short subunit dehydrogenase-like uncharacterized protein
MRAPSGATEEPEGDLDVVRSSDLRGHRLRWPACGAWGERLGIVAGRDAAKLDRIALETGLEHRAFGLDDPAAIDSALDRVAVVLNCAGPFKYTAEPLVEGCLRCRSHYLDITGEIPVYEAIQARDRQAKARGVMLLPGVGASTSSRPIASRCT